MSLYVRLRQLHLHEVQSVLADICGHFLNGNGTLADGIEGLRIVVVFKISRVVISLRSTIILKSRLRQIIKVRLNSFSSHHLENATDPEPGGTRPISRPSDVLALVGGEAGAVVPGAAGTLAVLELDPGDQVEKLTDSHINTSF